MVVPPGRRPSPRRSGSAPRSTTRSARVLHERGLRPRSATRAASRPTSRRARPRSRRSSRPPSAPAIATRVAIALDPATSEVFRDGAYRFEGRELGPGDSRFWDDLIGALPDRVDRGRSRRGRLGAWKQLTAELGDRVHSSATISSSPTRSACERGIDEGSGNSILVKVNQIGTLTETLEAIRMARRPATRRSSRTARARPRTRRSPISRSRRTPARSRRAPRRARTASRSTTSLLRIEEELGDAARIPGGNRSRVGSAESFQATG